MPRNIWKVQIQTNLPAFNISRVSHFFHETPNFSSFRKKRNNHASRLFSEPAWLKKSEHTSHNNSSGKHNFIWQLQFENYNQYH